MIFSHRGVQHQDFTKKNSHCFCLYKIHTQNNYVEQGKSCKIISLFCVKPKVICGKKLSSNLTRIYHFLLGLIGHGNFIECTYICTRLVSKTKNIYKNLKWTFWKINPVYLSKRKKWWSRPIEFSKWIEFFVLLRHKTINHQNIIISFHQISIFIFLNEFPKKNTCFYCQYFFMRRDLLHKIHFYVFSLAKNRV